MTNKVSWPSLETVKRRANSIRGRSLDIGICELFKNNPGKLLETLETNLDGYLQTDPEVKTYGDIVPVFPDAVTEKDITDFHDLLEDEIFANYFNLFLNLPIFPRRLTYRQNTKYFTIEPPIKRRKFRLDHTLVSAWVLKCRMPYFLKSDIYFEYRFSHELLNDLYFDTRSFHLYHELKTPVGVNRLRIFLHSRHMVKIMCFWMDAEKFAMLNDDKSRKECFNAIEILYLKSGSRFELPETLRKGILERLDTEHISLLTEVTVHSVPLLERIAKKEFDKIKNFSAVGVLIKAAQDEVMKFMRIYWIPRYFNRNGIPYAQSNTSIGTKLKSHLIWGPDNNAVPAELAIVANFKGQAPDDFLAEEDGPTQKTVASTTAQNETNKIWTDISKNLGQGRNQRKKLSTFSLFEQARRSSVAPRLMDHQLAELKEAHEKSIDLRKNSIPQVIQANSQGTFLKPIGLPFSKSRTDRLDSDGQKNTITVRTPKEKAPILELPRIVKPHRNSSLPVGNLSKLAPLPELTRSAPGCTSDESIDSDCSDLSDISEKMSIHDLNCDPYSLLQRVNPQLTENMSTDELNVRKWVIGALAANALIGQPMKDYLNLFQIIDSNVTETTTKSFPDHVVVALNNLDCWGRIERIRAISSSSYGGRRADEIVHAGGWGGIESPKLLPSYHHYLASISGEDLDTHLQPYKEAKYITMKYLDNCQKLQMDNELRLVLAQMLKSYTVNDTWLALLQEHCVNRLTQWVMKFFEFDNARLMMSCTSHKTDCKHGVIGESRSLTNINCEAFDPEVAKDLMYQYIYSPKSEMVWLSLFAIEVNSNRPVEVYFPPVPTTTKSVGCTCSPNGLGKLPGEAKDRAKHLRPKSIKMKEDHANLPRLQDITQLSVTSKRRNTLIQRAHSTRTVDIASSVSSTGKRKTAYYPTTFKQVLANQEYFNIFMKYLEVHDADEAEAPLINFWHQVEIMKSYKNAKARKDKANSLHKKYLFTPLHLPRREYLNVDCPPLLEIADKKLTTPALVVQAQTYVCKLIEDRWWMNYKAFMDDETSAKSILQSDVDIVNSNINCGKDYRANIRYLWGIFTFDMINFQNGLRNKQVFKQFKDYLIKTGAKLLNGKGKRIKDGNVFIYMNGMSIFAERLEYDLEFFVEIDRWIALKCDMAGPNGRLSKAAETLLTAKAQAIVSCFLKSAIPPRIRVNLGPTLIHEIEKKLEDNKKFYRGLFYNAVLHMVTMLLPFWKKFCFHLSAKESEKDRKLISTVSGHSLSTLSASPKQQSPINYCEVLHTEKLGNIVNKKVAIDKHHSAEPVKGLKHRLIQQDKVFGRRDATTISHSHVNPNEQLLYCFNLQSGLCNLKYESGLEVLHPCELFLSQDYERVEYLTEPLPRLKTDHEIPAGALNNRHTQPTSRHRHNSRLK